MIRSRSAGHVAALLLAATLFGACQATDQSPGPTTTASSGPTPTAPASPSVGPSLSAPAATLTIKPIPTKRWGDPAFQASAEAPGDVPVRFAASGGCKVDADSGKVTVQTVGTCTITATAQSSGSTLTASTKFKIEPAKPAIKFGTRETRFKSNLHFDLNASSTPTIKLAYKVIHGATGTRNDQYCAVTSDGFLVWTKKLTVEEHPGMDAKCMVRVTAAGKSENYSAPKAVQALVHIDYPSWKVNADTQSLTAAKAADGLWYVTVTVNEDNGTALGIEVNGSCGSGTTENTNVKVGTKVFKIRVQVNDPSSGTYTCTMHATALPQDYRQDNNHPGTPDVDFKLTVKKP
jgi:hypothetical protein